MSTDFERMIAAAEAEVEGYNGDRDIANNIARSIVEAVLDILRTPSEAAALAGGNAAMEASMSFRPAAFTGLAAIQATIDHIKREDA